MKRKGIIIATIIVIALISIIVIGNLSKNPKKENSNIKILTSFYPIYIMTLNITNGVENVEVSNMAQNFSGCIHDYTLTTADLKKFEDANIFIENGYGIENFSEKIIDLYPNVKIIESSEKITDKIYGENNEANAHFWTSVDNYILQVKEISEKLKEFDTKNSEKYEENTNKYLEKLITLQNEYNNCASNLKSKKVICLNESFSYLLKSLNIEENLISTDHEQSSLSAEVISGIIDKMKEEGINTIIIGENDDEKNALAIANETGAQIIKLNDCMSGENTLDSYINIMKSNLQKLQQII